MKELSFGETKSISAETTLSLTWFQTKRNGLTADMFQGRRSQEIRPIQDIAIRLAPKKEGVCSQP